MGSITPPYQPRYGAGIPVGSAANGTIYFDTANGFALWTAHNGTWKQSSSGVIVPLSVVQSALITASSASITLGAAPTSGNVLVAMCSKLANNVFNAAGWTLLFSNNGGNDGAAAMWKTAGVGESATQTPLDSVFNTGCLGIFEIGGGVGLVDNYTQQHDANFAPTIVNPLTTANSAELVLSLFCVANTGGIAIGGGATQDKNAAANSRSATIGHTAVAVAGTTSPQATATTQPVSGTAICVAIR